MGTSERTSSHGPEQTPGATGAKSARPPRTLPQQAGNAAMVRLLRQGTAHAVQRQITINNVKLNRHTLATELHGVGITKGTRAHTLLMPIALEWVKPSGGDHTHANAGALRTELTTHLSDSWVEEMRTELPTLYGFVSAGEFRTLVYMTKLQHGFSAAGLESTLKKARAALHIEQGSIKDAFGPGKLPSTDATFAIFTTDWAARVPGVEGLEAELQTAVSVDPTGLQKGNKVRLSQEFDLGGAMGGVTTQDADVSFVAKGGNKVLVEVASSTARLRDKMGVAGAAQRARYERLEATQDNVVLAYSTPGADWTEFFTGDVGDSIAERLPDLGTGNGWGLMIAGSYQSPDDLRAAATTIRTAEPDVPGFWKALSASGLTYSDAVAMDGGALASRLQRNARR